MTVCNPDEPIGNTNALFPYSPSAGQQVLMKESGLGGTPWTPGDFALLDVPVDAGGATCGGGGLDAIHCMLGLVNPLSHCATNDQVNVRPAEGQSANQSLNVRFDIYEGVMSEYQDDSDFAPSRNVVKGICRIDAGDCTNACSSLAQMAPTPSMPAIKHTVRLPRDSNIQADGDNEAVRLGNADWDRVGYWSVNHPDDGPWPPAGLAANATRYDVYRWEINNGRIPNRSLDGGENGDKDVLSASCSTQPGVNNPVRDRRMLTMAVVNCLANGLTGDNSTQAVKAVSYVRMFLTEPVGLNAAGAPSSGKSVFGEVIDVVRPGDPSGVFEIQPVLYR
jgi:hypothetical protein